jgi:hypothetical protein
LLLTSDLTAILFYSPTGALARVKREKISPVNFLALVLGNWLEKVYRRLSSLREAFATQQLENSRSRQPKCVLSLNLASVETSADWTVYGTSFTSASLTQQEASSEEKRVAA